MPLILSAWCPLGLLGGMGAESKDRRMVFTVFTTGRGAKMLRFTVGA